MNLFVRGLYMCLLVIALPVQGCTASTMLVRVETGNKSYRFLHSTAVAKKRIKARELARRADKQQPLEADS